MRKFIPLCLVALLLSLTLVACGDKPTIPTYSSGTSVTIPSAVNDQFKASLKDAKNPSLAAFKTTDDLAKVKASMQDSFKSGGWTDKIADVGGDTAVKQIEGVGGFLLGYEKDSTQVAVIGLPSAVAGPFGFTGLNAGENVYLVINGDK